MYASFVHAWPDLLQILAL